MHKSIVPILKEKKLKLCSSITIKRFCEELRSILVSFDAGILNILFVYVNLLVFTGDPGSICQYRLSAESQVHRWLLGEEITREWNLHSSRTPLHGLLRIWSKLSAAEWSSEIFQCQHGYCLEGEIPCECRAGKSITGFKLNIYYLCLIFGENSLNFDMVWRSIPDQFVVIQCSTLCEL